MKFPASILGFIFPALFIGLGTPAIPAEHPKKPPTAARPVSRNAEDDPSSQHRKTTKEKEYSELANTVRKADQDLEKAWRSAKPANRRKLRGEHLDKLQPTLARMNQLAMEIREEQRPPMSSVTSGVSLAPSDEIRDKSDRELLQMGVAREALQVKPQASGAAQQSRTTGSSTP